MVSIYYIFEILGTKIYIFWWINYRVFWFRDSRAGFEVRFWAQMRRSHVFKVQSFKVRNVESSVFWCLFNLYILFRQATNQENWAFLLRNCFESKEKLEKMVSDLYWLMWKMEFMDAYQYEKNLIDNILYVKRWLDW